MRLLSGGADHVCCGTAREKQEADGRRYRRRDERQYLSMRNVPANPQRDSSRRRRGAVMNVVKVSRRDFVKITSAASAGLVLGLQVRRASAEENELHPLGAFVHVG